MKKLFTLVLALMGFAGAANAATVDEVAPLKHSYVLVCDELGARPGKGHLFGDSHFLDVTGGSYATNKGKVNLAEADGVLVTEEIAAKYGEYGEHLNTLRLKNDQDYIAMKVTAGSKIMIFYNNNGADRYPMFGKDKPTTNPLDNQGTATETVNKIARMDWTADNDMTVYIGGKGGDQFISFIIVEANEAPGTPQVKLGEQKYENGLWFREVTCKPTDMQADGATFPTIVTYTTDGTAPTAASPIYKEPVKCYADMTVKFQAFMDIMMDGQTVLEDAIAPNADNEANVSFSFDAPTISAEGANVTISSNYEGAKNFVMLNDAETAEETSSFTLEESATVKAYSQIVNGSYATFTTKSTTKDVYVLNPIKEQKTIAVTAGDVVVDEEATATSTTGTIYKVENGAISADKKDFFVKNLEFAVVKDAQYQIDGKEAYVKMNTTNISFLVAEGDTVNVKVITTKNSCKTLNPDNDESLTTDRKNFVNVSGTTYGNEDVTAEDGNIITFGLRGGEGGTVFTFQKYSGTGNIMISSIEITPVAETPAVQETVLWEGESIVNGWGNQPIFLSDGGAELTEAGAAVGDKLRIYATAPDDNWQVEFTEGHWGGMYVRYAAKDLGPNSDGSERTYSIVDLAAQGYLEYTITEEFLTNATTVKYWGGVFLLNGDGNMTVTKVTLVKGAGDTAVQTVKSVKTNDGAIYNLAGQKVANGYKGVVIINGKKALLK